MVTLRYAIMINGVTRLFMMKTDVLNDFGKLPVATAYLAGDQKIDRVPFDLGREQFEIFYEDLKGWNTELKDLRDRAQMPEALGDYVNFIEKSTGVPMIGLSYGPDREDTLFF
jgi:adenylosuccinate synthase